jgi:hypothetical protein
MGILTRWRRRRQPYAAQTDEERMARYVYLLNTLPSSVVESAHATAFAELPAPQRREMFEQLRPFLSENERGASADDPTVLARLFRRAEEHRAERARRGSAERDDAASGPAVVDGADTRTMLTNAGVMTIVANQFLLSAAVSAYFTVGAGSLALASEPAWVSETFDASGGGGWDSGSAFGDGGGGAAGWDAGGFGGFDGGGFAG